MSAPIVSSRLPQIIPRGPVMIDVAGYALTAAECERLLHPQVGGVILFRRNFESPKQIAALCAEIRSLRTPALLIAVDHEGGRVQRFLEGFTRLPPMRVLGQQYAVDPEGGMRCARNVGEVLATELRAVGVDLSFAPVLDLDWERSGIIGDRAFSARAEEVALLAAAVREGMALGGMAACGKHFPGHGWVVADSHHAIPVDERDFEALWRDDIQPFAVLSAAGLEAVMPAHVVYPQVDVQPAGFSVRWLQEILRGKLGFEGVIFSDDLCMEGAAGMGGIVERAHAALAAGCDMALVCNRPDFADDVLAGLADRALAPELAARLERVQGRLSVEAALRKMRTPEFAELQAQVATLAVPPEQLAGGVMVGEAY